MIETRELFDALKDSNYPYLVVDDWHEAVWGTIESLRTVARAAKERQLWYQPPEDIEAALNEALDDLPQWVLEETE